MITREELQARVEALAAEAQVTGVAAGISIGDDSITAHCGAANLHTGAPVRSDTLFAAGSVTKVFTAALLMTLVDEGRLGLDDPIVSHLSEFTMGDDARAGQVTARMLLSHTAGLPGFCMYDLAKGPDMLARSMAVLDTYPFNSPPGRYWSYSNAGMLVAGRLVEVLTGQTWDAALEERILRPLACHASSDTNQLILNSTAVGHAIDPATGKAERLNRFQLDLSNGPAGTTLWCDVEALLRFARMHLKRGAGPAGDPVLSEASVREMQTPQVAVPWGIGNRWGLGWHIRDEAAAIFTHSGGNAGMNSILTLLPGHGMAIAVLTNSVTGALVTQRLNDDLMADLLGVTAPSPPAAPAAPPEVDLGAYPGRYVADEGAVVTDRGGRLQVESEVTPQMQTMMRQLYTTFPPPPMTLTPFAADGRFVSDAGLPVSFVTEAGSTRPDYVYVGRIYRRAPS